MSSVYAGVETYHGSIVIPSDGDPAVAESVNDSLRDLMDNSIVFRTAFEHMAADDRGTTNTITGPIVWNDGGGSVSFNLPFEVTQQSDLDVTHFPGDVVVLTGSNFQGNDDPTIGNTGTDQFTVNRRGEV